MYMELRCINIEEYDQVVALVIGPSYTKNPCMLDLDLKNWESPLVKPSIIELAQLELKLFSLYLCYVLLGENNTFPIIIVNALLP